MKKGFFRPRNIVIFSIAAVVLAGAVIFFASRGKSAATYVTDVVAKKDLVQTVSEVGTVESPSEIDLNFNEPGKLAAKFAAIGDQVKAGEILAQLDSSALNIQRDQAAASLAGAQASLAKLLQGAAPAQLAVAQAQADQAKAANQAALDNLNKTSQTVALNIKQAQNNLNDLQGLTATTTTYQQGVIAAQTALANVKTDNQKAIDSATTNLLNDLTGKLSAAVTALDNINTIITDTAIKDYLSSKNKTYLSLANSDYASAQTLLSTANASLAATRNSQNQSSVDQAAADGLACLKEISSALSDIYNALVNSSISNQTVLNNYKTNISAQITATNGAINTVSVDQQNFDNAYLAYNTNVTAAQNSLDSAQAAWNNAITAAKNALSSAQANGNQQNSAAANGADTAKQTLAVAEKQLAQLKAPPRAEDINLAQSQVNNAQAALDLANKQIDDAMIKSPIDGQIVKDNYSVGEQTSLATPVFSMLAQNDLEISVDISESDIAKLKQGDAAQITLDAFGPDQKFNGSVYFIDPASTVIQDVTYYRVKIKFTDPVEQLAQIKPGMTANTTIIADKRTNVLTVPERAVIAQTNGDKIVRVLNKGNVAEVPVKVGLRGDDGSVEITEGNLQPGQTVVVFTNTK
ncbi:MAG TPA: efflux RND transporter periplasmic adaptor subunit [Candidatus Nanoarchaeia archaeon]|nr:efflux RND transporter periplasmic adaptor subunit [Candidatus Nanoarchaeia archaeon]